MQEERISRYLSRHAFRLKQLEAMWRDPLVQLYNDPELPHPLIRQQSVFLAGPTSRRQILEYNWRSEAVALLREAHFPGVIYVPEPRGEEDEGDFTEKSYIDRWWSDRLLSASHSVFWVPRQGVEMLGLNTNFEWGFMTAKFLFMQEQAESQELFVGWPDGAERMGLPNHYISDIAKLRRFRTLSSLCYTITSKSVLSEML